jgi:hypothetical protein
MNDPMLAAAAVMLLCVSISWAASAPDGIPWGVAQMPWNARWGNHRARVRVATLSGFSCFLLGIISPATGSRLCIGEQIEFAGRLAPATRSKEIEDLHSCRHGRNLRYSANGAGSARLF